MKTTKNVLFTSPGKSDGFVSVLCPKVLKQINSEKGKSEVAGMEHGQIMVDPYAPGKIWVTFGYTKIDEITEYNTLRSKFEPKLIVLLCKNRDFSKFNTGPVILQIQQSNGKKSYYM